MLKYRKQTEKVFEGKHGGTGVRQRNKLKIIIKKKTLTNLGRRDWSVGLNVTIFMSECVGEGNCL